MTVAEVAALTEYTEANIRYQCEQGRLKAVKVKTGANGRPGWHIEKRDYLTWLRDLPAWNRRTRGKRGMRA